ncbi:6797_t:CDS:2 [Paraglomus brasilianum]|uniref:6797_t:CDS:1 n=1 Tax=Paraglomus brasilianum TaxID=144538 RepID=A0A9N8VI23_9GLOM|nr:6797_t:CDS:2 [Paraglomus brasilianum]
MSAHYGRARFDFGRAAVDKYLSQGQCEHAVGPYILLLREDESIKLVKADDILNEVAFCKLTSNSNVSCCMYRAIYLYKEFPVNPGKTSSHATNRKS